MNAMPGQADHVRHNGKRHVPAERQDHGFEQQGEAVEFPGPTWIDHSCTAIGQDHAGDAYFENGFMLKEIEMSETLDLGIVDGVQAFRIRVRKSGSRNKVDVDDQQLFGFVEIESLNEPWR